MAELSLEKVTKEFGFVRVIHGVDLSVASGEFVVFVGPSGCGKSTLLRLIAGLDTVTSGTVRIAGEDVTRKPASERGLAMVFQSYALYPHMSVRENMAFALENTRMAKPEIESRVARAARMLRLEPYLDRKPKALSGGQRQRVAIGRAIVRDPRVFLFDEPLSNLDAELRVATRKEIAALHAEIGGTMIYVTHDQVEAMTLANRIVVLRAGIVEQVGTPLELYNRPDNVFVAGFIGSPAMNLAEGTVAATAAGPRLRVGEAELDVPGLGGLPPGSRATLGVRPEHVSLANGAPADVEARATLVEQLGGDTFVSAEAQGWPALTVRLPGQAPVARGDAVPLRLDRAALHLFDASGRAHRPS